ncbi:zinc-binding dehydrogenase [Aeromicrobium sp.]|uniref:zinc-binding dehydrogenase n=1 Tax=Aeromicrobium sp. TaxID=1871063 RepID=UPI003D6BABF2
MKAVVCQDAKLSVAEVPDPEPGKGQLLINVQRAGICGSDLHARLHCDDVADIVDELGYPEFMRSSHSVVMGHEFVGEVVGHGPGSRKQVKVGDRVVALPLLRRGNDVHTVGFSVQAPGAYAEQMVVEESLAMTVPDDMPTELATLTEPMAVGLHAVRRGEVKKGDVAVVIGCGPVGLAVISMLKASGVKTVVASDFSPGRRDLARRCGANVVVDPEQEAPYAAGGDHGHLTTAPAAFGLAIGAMDRLRGLPLVPWQHVWRAAEKVGAANPKRPVIFECVGVPGILEQIITSAPLFSRVVVVGVCMQPDQLRPAVAINKEIDLRFVLGYTPPEFHETLRLLASGKVIAAPIVTGSVGLPGVDNAFTTLGDPEVHAKILVDPQSDASEPVRRAS